MKSSPISEGMSFVFNSMLSCRKSLRVDDIQRELESIVTYLGTRGCVMTGPYVLQLHSGNFVDGELVFDIEIFVPVPQGIFVEPPYTFVPQLRIGNSVSMRYSGSLNGLREKYDLLYGYMRVNGLEPVSGIYHIQKEGSPLIDTNNFLSVDICIGTRKATSVVGL